MPTCCTCRPLATFVFLNKIFLAIVVAYTVIPVFDIAGERKLVSEESLDSTDGLIVVETQDEPDRLPLLKSAPGLIPIATRPCSTQVESGEAQLGQENCRRRLGYKLLKNLRLALTYLGQ